MRRLLPYLAPLLLLALLSGTPVSGQSNPPGDRVNYHTSVGVTEDETEIKATAGKLVSVTITNTNAAARYFRCYNLTAANTVPGTSPVYLGFAIPALPRTGGAHTFGPNGLAFSVALTCTLTTGQADSDVAEVAADEIKWTIGYR